jgi:hypothetical protein
VEVSRGHPTKGHPAALRLGGDLPPLTVKDQHVNEMNHGLRIWKVYLEEPLHI